MIIDDRKHFVELTVDAIMCGKVKYDFSYFSSKNPDELTDIMKNIGSWIGERNNQDSDKFKKLTDELFLEFVSSRGGQQLQGEVIDDGLEKENMELKTKIKTLELDNKQAVEQLAGAKGELDELKGVKPVNKEFHGFK